MSKQDVIKKAWEELNFVPEKTNKNGYIDYELLPEEFDFSNLDFIHDPLPKKPRKTWVRPKRLKKDLGLIITLKRFFRI